VTGRVAHIEVRKMCTENLKEGVHLECLGIGGRL